MHLLNLSLPCWLTHWKSVLCSKHLIWHVRLQAPGFLHNALQSGAD